tara:strand:+ start:2907 stop:3890 length:984 start_codon:yes stop_codon:yes gene_type:complete
MSYSFFGTCANDHYQFFECLNTIVEQTILPKEIILVNSGEEDIKNYIIEKIKNKNIDLVYISQKSSRVKSLNLAIDKSNSEYSFRFDSRSRFSKSYAENALKILNDKSINAVVVGGVPSIISESKDFQSILCAEIFRRSYIFFYPRHRNIKYSGYASSLYLGCFKTDLLKKIRFNENKSLISEDSLIINDFLDRGYKAYISSKIKVSYKCRSSFINIIRLFNTYGYCRANTIFISKKIFISKRHFFIFLILFMITTYLIIISPFYLIFLPIFILLVNFFGEINFYNRDFKIYIPIYATLCQFSWILGFLWRIISILKNNNTKSNFIS